MIVDVVDSPITESIVDLIYLSQSYVRVVALNRNAFLDHLQKVVGNPGDLMIELGGSEKDGVVGEGGRVVNDGV